MVPDFEDNSQKWSLVYVKDEYITNFKVKNNLEFPLDKIKVNFKILKNEFLSTAREKKNSKDFPKKKKNFLYEEINLEVLPNQVVNDGNEKYNYYSYFESRGNFFLNRGFSVKMLNQSQFSFRNNVFFAVNFLSEMTENEITINSETSSSFFTMNFEDLTFKIELNNFDQRENGITFQKLKFKKMKDLKMTKITDNINKIEFGKLNNDFFTLNFKFTENQVNKGKNIKTIKPQALTIYCELIIDGLKRSFGYKENFNAYNNISDPQKKNEFDVRELCDYMPNDNSLDYYLSNPFVRVFSIFDLFSLEVLENGVLTYLKISLQGTSEEVQKKNKKRIRI